MTPAPIPTGFDLAALDMAGTTIDERGLVYQVLEATVADTVGAPVPADLLQRWKGTSKREAITGLLTGLGADADQPATDAVFAAFTERLLATYRENPPTPFPGAVEMLATLRAAAVKVALQTGYSAEIAGAILAGLDWAVGSGPSSVVDAIVTSDQVPASRPAPYLVFRCMEATAVNDVRRVLVAGDTPNDLRAGHNAGAGLVVGVGTGSFTLDQLAAEPHTHLLASTADLPALL
ncbi:phosphonatase-like hydrolase [Actinopolymorpha pittospori]|uniref:Phosphonatase-like hydrolase n=1 Tax=Actinopolymorpha pittospori TaxID=648752 RepID=A0A927MNQ6_9ACTN|nr:phosphonatase-like hydrolase [Actinopolymorpha pittospori]MBE1604071.1 phosphonatase-like hydrolase [Actinopolymorpha pittospori]